MQVALVYTPFLKKWERFLAQNQAKHDIVSMDEFLESEDETKAYLVQVFLDNTTDLKRVVETCARKKLKYLVLYVLGKCELSESDTLGVSLIISKPDF